MCRGIVREEEVLTVQMSIIKNFDGILHLFEKLLSILPWISIRTRINYFPSILQNFTIMASNDKMFIFFIDEVRDMNELSTTFFQ